MSEEPLQNVSVVKMLDSLTDAWCDLCRIFRSIQFYRFSKQDIDLTKRIYRAHGNDHVTINLLSREWKEALELLSTFNIQELSYLKKLSAINLTHLDEHVKRKATLYFVIYPTFFSFLLNKVPKLLFGADLLSVPIFTGYILIVAIGSLMFFKFYTNKWQAMEFDTCLEMVLARKQFECDR